MTKFHLHIEGEDYLEEALTSSKYPVAAHLLFGVEIVVHFLSALPEEKLDEVISESVCHNSAKLVERMINDFIFSQAWLEEVEHHHPGCLFHHANDLVVHLLFLTSVIVQESTRNSLLPVHKMGCMSSILNTA